MSYLQRRFLAFGSNDGCYGHIHFIVYSNDLILHTSMHIRTTDNVDEESLNFRWIKISFSIFGVSKTGFFVKHLPKICYKIVPQKFIDSLDHILSTNTRFYFSKKLSIQLFWKRQISADLVETEPNLNYRCLLVCSWFLENHF